MKPKRNSRKITMEEFCTLRTPALEDVLAILNGGKYEKFFLDRPREYPDGSKKYLTRKGAKLYRLLTSLLENISKITAVDEVFRGGYSTGDVIEELDEIVRDYQQ